MALVLPLPIGQSFAFHVVLSTRRTPSSEIALVTHHPVGLQADQAGPVEHDLGFARP
jgi:hypothetical protein